MLVYGDPWREIELADWRERAGTPLPAAAWIDAHAELVARLIEAGQILQALEDERFRADGERDRADESLDPLRLHLTELARAVGVSWRSRRAPDAAPSPAPLPRSGRLRAREPEGYAFYALYPEACFEAAQQARAQGGADLVIGLRSIGASLAPMVAAGLGLPLFWTLRPKGDAFDRVIEAPDLAGRLRRSPPRRVAIVDEGPGLSGSSFAAAARFVRSHAPQSEAHLFPSHPWGPGSEAGEETHRLFRTAPQTVVGFDQLTAAHHAAAWFEDLVGPPLVIEDVSGGAWRSHVFAGETEWPAVDCMQERRKFLLRTGGGSFLMKFLGLGRLGESKAGVARALAQAGLAPEVIAFRHGFLLERWRGDARPLDPKADRALLLPAMARYLAFRRKRLPRPRAFGASLAELREMARRNVALALGEAACAHVLERLSAFTAWEGSVKRIATDNRMHAHEWIVTANGDVLKTDAADHHAGHDLIGAQDVIWDIAGAAIAFDLTDEEAKRLCDRIEAASGEPVLRPLLAPMRLVWLAFETGRLTLAAQAGAGSPEEARLKTQTAALMQMLKQEIGRVPSSTAGELQSHTLVWPT